MADYKYGGYNLGAILSGSPTHLLLEVTFMAVGEPDYWILCPTEERARGRYCGDFRCYWVILC